MSGTAGQEVSSGDDNNIHHFQGTDPNEKALDGTVGGALDQGDATDEDDGGLNDPMTASDEGQTPEGAMPSYEDKKLAQDIIDAMEEMQGLDNEVSQINAAKSAIIERLESQGIKRKAFRLAYAFKKADKDQRDGLDLSYLICRAAIGEAIDPKDFGLVMQEAG